LLKGKKILIADDNRLNQRILIFVLEKNGATVVAANNGLEAIEHIKSSSFDTVIMDLQMPEMGGLEASTYIRKTLNSTTPIIGLTANNLERDNKMCLDAGMDICVSKPFEPAELCTIISEIIQKQNNTCQ
jgi:two-component system sensor histidine kinase/response regulator